MFGERIRPKITVIKWHCDLNEEMYFRTNPQLFLNLGEILNPRGNGDSDGNHKVLFPISSFKARSMNAHKISL